MNLEKYYIEAEDETFNYDSFYQRFKKDLQTARRKESVILSALVQLDNFFSDQKRFEFDFEKEYPEYLSALREAKAEINKNKEETAILILDRFFNSHYKELYYDEITHTTYHTENKKTKELDESSMFLKLTDKGVMKHVSEKTVLRYLETSICKRNPIREFFESLPKWDGRDHAKRYISLFDVIENIPGTNRREFITEQYKKYGVRVINQAIGEGTMEDINKCSLVYLSPPGSGKTTFIKQKQFPEALFKKFSTDILFEKDNNSIIGLTTQLISYRDDFNSFANKEHNFSGKEMTLFKTFTGQEEFPTIKRGKKTNRKRICSFIFSANDGDTFKIHRDDLLTRFLILHHSNDSTNQLPFDKWNQGDTLMIWSQFMSIWKQDNRAGQMTPEENIINKRINETYKWAKVTDLNSIINLYIKPATDHEGANYTAEELVEAFKKSSIVPEHIKETINSRALGHYIQKFLGIKQTADSTKKCNRAYRLIIKL